MDPFAASCAKSNSLNSHYPQNYACIALIGILFIKIKSQDGNSSMWWGVLHEFCRISIRWAIRNIRDKLEYCLGSWKRWRSFQWCIHKFSWKMARSHKQRYWNENSLKFKHTPCSITPTEIEMLAISANQFKSIIKYCSSLDVYIYRW